MSKIILSAQLITLIRHIRWINDNLADSEEMQRNLLQLVSSILTVMLDENPKVQEAASSALIKIFDSLADNDQQDVLESSVPQILMYVQKASDMYGAKNSLILCDVIGVIHTTFEKVISEKSSDCTPYYLPFMVKKLEQFDDPSDPNMLIVLENFALVVRTIKLEIQSAALLLFHRALIVIEEAMRRHKEDLTEKVGDDSCLLYTVHDDEYVDFVVYGLQLLEDLAVGLCDNFSVLLTADTERIRVENIINYCIGDHHEDVRALSFGFLGSLDTLCYPKLNLPYDNVLRCILVNFDPIYPGPCQNAVWLLGELVLKGGKEMIAPHLSSFVSALVQLVNKVDEKKGFDPLQTSIWERVMKSTSPIEAVQVLYFYNEMSIDVRLTATPFMSVFQIYHPPLQF